MNRTTAAVVAVLIFGPCFFALARSSKKEPEQTGPAVLDTDIAVYFSPKGGCEEAVVEQVKAAKKTIDLQAYTFTNKDIAKAVGEAQERGVKVRAIFDRKENGSQYSSATYLFDHKVATFLDGKHPIAHNKIIIIDSKIVLTGSYNFTEQANNNGENLLVINRAKVAAGYEANFEKHLEHSEKYEGVKAP